MSLVKSLTLDWKSLIDTNFPVYSIPYTLQNRLKGKLHTTFKEYEKYRKRILETDLP